jgi:DNA-binding transcriptional MerR regulator
MTDKAVDAFRTISEVAEDLDLPQHVLRFWETKFPHIKPLKRGGGRRYYRADDVDLVRGIRYLLYAQGYTIKGVQRIIKEQGVKTVMSVWKSPGDDGAHTHSVQHDKYRLPENNTAATRGFDENHPLDNTAQVSEELIAAIETYDLDEPANNTDYPSNYQQRPDVSIMRGGLAASARTASTRSLETNNIASMSVTGHSSKMSDHNPEKGSLVLTIAERSVLMNALQDLSECRRILDAAGQN